MPEATGSSARLVRRARTERRPTAPRGPIARRWGIPTDPGVRWGPRWLLASALLLLAACAPARSGAQLPTAPPTPTLDLPPIELPRDEAPHGTLTEWWYYTGHLAAADGRRYGFELTFFQFTRGGQLLTLGHFAVTDHARRAFRFAERAARAPAADLPRRLDLRLDDWALAGEHGRDRLAAQMDGYALTLALEPLKPPALHGDAGLISMGAAAGQSYYYSRTRVRAAGTLENHGEPLPVEGTVWHDHQWGDFIVDPTGGWDWFALQLDDGTELMLFTVRDAAGRPSAYGSFVDAAGVARSVGPSEVQVEPTGHWTSPQSGGTYPVRWTVRLASPPTALRLEPVLEDQELRFPTVTYWEGELSVSGTRAGRPIGGWGYLELTGYAPRVASR